MGIRSEHVTVLGCLDLVETRTRFIIEPFVGFFKYPYPYNTNPMEVSQVLEVPVTYLLESCNAWEEIGLWRQEPRPEYYYVFGEHIIFGATARILNQFLRLIG